MNLTRAVFTVYGTLRVAATAVETGFTTTCMNKYK